MKKVFSFIIAVLILGGVGYALWQGSRTDPAPDETDPTTPAEVESHSDELSDHPFVALEPEQIEALGIEVVSLEPLTKKPLKKAYGSVLDPMELLALDAEISSAEAYFSASKEEYDRIQKLAAGNDASRRAEETAQTQFLADQIKVKGLRRNATLQWGTLFGESDPERSKMMDDLSSGKIALVRLDLLPGDFAPEVPTKATVTIAGRDDQTLTSTQIHPATSSNPKTQSQGFILQIQNSPFPLRPGMAITSWLEFPGDSESGYSVPRSAIVRHNGEAWVFCSTEGGFERVPVELIAPLENGDSWFARGDEALSTESKIVVVGAASLLSEELTSLAGDEEE